MKEFLFILLGLVLIYTVARLVFAAWFKTKEEFKKGGEDASNKK